VERVTATEAESVAKAEAEERKAVEQFMHWAVEMDNALAYQRDVDRRDIARREATRRVEIEHRIERRMIVHRQEATIHAAMAAIEDAGISGNSDGGALQ
jgi:hypothetical protein